MEEVMTMTDCVFCDDPIKAGEGTTDESGALAHATCAEVEFATQRWERAETALRTIADTMHPERMTGSHLTPENRLQAAYAIIDQMQRTAREAAS